MLLYKDAVMPIEGIAPVSQSWAKKHILGFSDEEIKLDLQQQRVEKAISTEIQNTPNVITKTGLFDNIDKLYGNGGSPTTGATETEATGGFGEIPTEPAAPEAGIEAPAEAGITPESLNKKMSVILERENFGNIEEIDLNKGNRSLGEIENQLGKLID